MPAFSFEWIKEHPGIAAATIGGGALVLFLVLRGSGGSSGVATYGDPNAALEYQYAGQTQQIQGSLAAQGAQQSFELAAKRLDVASQDYTTDASLKVALATLEEQGKSTAAQLQVALQRDANATHVQEAAIAATLAQSTNALTVQQNIATIAANEQQSIAASTTAAQIRLAELSGYVQTQQIQASQYIAGLAAYTQVVGSNNNANVAINQTNKYAEVGIAQTRAAVDIANKQADNNLFGQIVQLATNVAFLAL